MNIRLLKRYKTSVIDSDTESENGTHGVGECSFTFIEDSIENIIQKLKLHKK